MEHEDLIEKRKRSEEEDWTEEEICDPLLVPTAALQIQEEVVETGAHLYHVCPLSPGGLD